MIGVWTLACGIEMYETELRYGARSGGFGSNKRYAELIIDEVIGME